MRVILIPVKKILTPQVRVKDQLAQGKVRVKVRVKVKVRVRVRVKVNEELALGKVRVIFCVNVIVAGGRSALRPH